MKISHELAPSLLVEHYYPDIASRKCIHILTSFCWFALIFLGTTLIGIGTSNISLTYAYCSDLETFCTQSLLVNTTTTLYFYVVLDHFSQNNRYFLDSFSTKQLHGEVDNRKRCGEYYSYGSLGLTQTMGGYRVNSSAHAHPCGEVMNTYAVDTVYLVNSQGGTPQLDNGDLVSSFAKNYHFTRLSQYQLAQWVDVQSQQFINYFTVPPTNKKYQLVGKASVSAGNYQIVMQNNFLTQGEFTKQLLVSQVGLLGATNHVLGFTLFAYGILVLFLHVFVCFKWRK